MWKYIATIFKPDPYGIDQALRNRKAARSIICDPARRAAETRRKRALMLGEGLKRLRGNNGEDARS